jgi:hypothetical protein
VRDHGAREQICPLQDDVLAQIPLVFLKLTDALAHDDTGIVAENMNRAKGFDHLCRSIAAIVCGANVAAEKFCRPSGCGDHFRCLSSALLVDVECRHGGSHLGQKDRNAAADAGSSARDHRRLTLQRQQLESFVCWFHREAPVMRRVPSRPPPT